MLMHGMDPHTPAGRLQAYHAGQIAGEHALTRSDEGVCAVPRDGDVHGKEDEIMPEPVDQKPVINSHTQTEFGLYDAEPFPVEGNTYYWYLRAVYWKCEANRKDGVQTTMEFTQKSRQETGGKIVLSLEDMKIV